MPQKLKSFLGNDAIFTSLLVILVAVISFGLGRSSVSENGLFAVSHTVSAPVMTAEVVENSPVEGLSPGVILQEAPASTEAAPAEKATTTPPLVGSRSGTKYHFVHCPGAKQIKEENKVFFNSIEQARAAGYTPAANCPGLQ